MATGRSRDKLVSWTSRLVRNSQSWRSFPTTFFDTGGHDVLLGSVVVREKDPGSKFSERDWWRHVDRPCSAGQVQNPLFFSGFGLGLRSMVLGGSVGPKCESQSVLERHFGSCDSLTNSVLRDVKRRTQLVKCSGNECEYENFLPWSYGGKSRLYCTNGQTLLSKAEKDGDDGRGEKGARVLVGKHETAASGESIWIRRLISDRFWAFFQLARLDKPIGTWLLAWPCFWSICLAAPSGSLPDLKMLGWFGLGAVLLRGAGCTVNDLWDRDIDGMVERTQRRPIASGVLTPAQGISFLGCQLLLGLGVLLQLNNFSRVLGASSLLLVGTYPLMKRWTFWPQAYLGLTFNWGALLGWAAVHGNLDLSAVLPLYASGVCWTLVYDTIYAHQDKEDDLKVGVKSTALRFGNKTRLWLTGFSALSVGSLTLAGLNCGLGWPFYVGMIASAGHLAWQVSTVDIHSRLDCNSKFVSNKWFGATVCGSIVLGKLAAVPLV